jgi:acetoin utilization deacetylase AcuC-like enzyme
MNVYYSSDYVAAAESFDTTRKSAWIAESLGRDPVPGADIVAPEPLAFEDIAKVHAAEYVRAVRIGTPLDLAQSQGFMWDPGMWKSVTASNGGVVAAARAALKDGVSGSLSSGLHHAQRSTGAAFCTFNGLVIAAKTVLREGAQSVLIIDLDAHCGGGTHSMIEEDDRIRQLDVGVNVLDAYWMNGKNTLDIVRDSDRYLPTVESRLSELDGSFDLCIYNAGMDVDERCAVGGFPGITAQILRERERMVFSWAREHGVPVAFVLAGGYSGGRLPRDELVKLHRMTIETAASLSVKADRRLVQSTHDHRVPVS